MNSSKKHLSFWQDECHIEDFVKWCGHDNYWKSFLRNYIISKEHKSILDAGAGLCLEYFAFKSLGYNIEYSATEITEKFVDMCRDQEINVIKTDIVKMPYEDNSFDVVICYDVLNHQTCFRDPITELLRVTKKECIITFFKPFAEEIRAQNEISNSIGRFKITNIEDTGILLDRFTNKNNEPVCYYNFFYIEKLLNFLNSISGIEYRFSNLINENQNETKTYCVIRKLTSKKTHNGDLDL